MEEVRTLLHKIINDTNLALSSEEVVTISQQLDKLILKFYLEQNE
ncbi:aspartyl-phosphate phosphatase Spo0E family protein [Haloimpatiens massiliensis]|nr:aspartyl-phosphate phosphatase Spo0E family protein [Haloimpatiens massiliensis]